jgi:hypothetical protein
VRGIKNIPFSTGDDGAWNELVIFFPRELTACTFGIWCDYDTIIHEKLCAVCIHVQRLCKAFIFFLSFQGAVAGLSHKHTHTLCAIAGLSYRHIYTHTQTHTHYAKHSFFFFRGCCAVAGLSWFVFIMFYSVIYFDPKFEELIARFESIVSACACACACVCVCVCTCI